MKREILKFEDFLNENEENTQTFKMYFVCNSNDVKHSINDMVSKKSPLVKDNKFQIFVSDVSDEPFKNGNDVKYILNGKIVIKKQYPNESDVKDEIKNSIEKVLLGYGIDSREMFLELKSL